MGVLLSCEIVDKYQSINYFMGTGLLFLVATKSNFEYPLGNVLFLGGCLQTLSQNNLFLSTSTAQLQIQRGHLLNTRHLYTRHCAGLFTVIILFKSPNNLCVKNHIIPFNI